MNNKMKITLFSAACCDPQQGVYDQKYLLRIDEALEQTAVEAQVNSILATEALYGQYTEYTNQLRTLFDKYGMAVAPALFINGELVIYGTLPSTEKLVELIEENAEKNRHNEDDIS